MLNTQTSGPMAQPTAFPYVYSVKTVKQALLRSPVRYHARPLFQGAAVILIVTANDAVITPSHVDVFGNNGFGFNRDEFLECRDYLRSYNCDAIRFDGRALPVEGKADPIIDFFRMSFLRNGKATLQKLIHPEFPDGRDAGLQRYYVEIGKNKAALQLDFAKGLSSTFPRKLGPPYTGVKAPVDGILWASEETLEASMFLIPTKAVP